MKAVNPYIPSEGAHRDPQVQSMGFLGAPGYKLKSKGVASSPREQRQRSLFLHYPPEGEAGSHKRSGGARLQSGQPNSEFAWAAEASGCGGGGQKAIPQALDHPGLQEQDIQNSPPTLIIPRACSPNASAGHTGCRAEPTL